MTLLRDPDLAKASPHGPKSFPWGFAVAVGLVICCALAALVAGLRAPLTYDEAYNLQVVRHLAHTGMYATDGAIYDGEPRLFDAYITTGPTLLVPAAVMVELLGDHLWVARIAPTAGFLLLLGSAGVAGRRVAGRWGAVFGVLAVLMVDLDGHLCIVAGGRDRGRPGGDLNGCPSAGRLTLSAQPEIRGVVVGVGLHDQDALARVPPGVLVRRRPAAGSTVSGLEAVDRAGRLVDGPGRRLAARPADSARPTTVGPEESGVRGGVPGSRVRAGCRRPPAGAAERSVRTDRRHPRAWIRRRVRCGTADRRAAGGDISRPSIRSTQRGGTHGSRWGHVDAGTNARNAVAFRVVASRLRRNRRPPLVGRHVRRSATPCYLAGPGVSVACSRRLGSAVSRCTDFRLRAQRRWHAGAPRRVAAWPVVGSAESCGPRHRGVGSDAPRGRGGRLGAASRTLVLVGSPGQARHVKGRSARGRAHKEHARAHLVRRESRCSRRVPRLPSGRPEVGRLDGEWASRTRRAPSGPVPAKRTGFRDPEELNG